MRLTSFLLFCITYTLGFGQALSFTDYVPEFITHADDYINCRENILIDRSGMIWIATPDQLLLYDGSGITPYSATDPIHKIDITDIQVFEASSDGNFFMVNSANEILVFDPTKKTVTNRLQVDITEYPNLANTYSGENTGSLFINHTLVANDSGGFYVLFENKEGSAYFVFHSQDGSDLEFFKSLPIDGIPSMTYADGYLFLAQKHGAQVYDIKANLISNFDQLFTGDNTIPMLTKSANGQVFVYQNCKSKSCLVYEYSKTGQSFEPIVFPPSLDMTNIHKIRWTEHETWFFGVNKLILYDHQLNSHQDIFKSISEQFKNIEPAPLISHYTSVTKYDPGTIWLSSGYGLVKLEPKEDAIQLILKSDPGLCNTFCSMRGMDMDNQGNLWMASYSGIIKRSPKKELSKLSQLDTILQEGVYSLNVEGDHLLVNDILYHFKSKQYKILIPQKENGHVTNISDGNGDFWMATCYANGNYINWYHHAISEGVTSEIDLPPDLQQAGQVTDMALSVDKRSIWFTTANVGSYRFDIASRTFHSITPRQYWENDNRHYCIYELKDKVFIGNSNALLKLDLTTNEIEDYTLKNIRSDGSTFDRNYFSILHEDDNNLWLGTDKGVLGFDIANATFLTLTEYGAIGNEEFNRESIFKSPEGLLMFGSVNGVYMLDPKKIDLINPLQKRNINLISSHYLDGKSNDLAVFSLQDSEGVELNHNDKMLSFKVALPQFKKAQKAFFSYYLDGFDNEWSKPSKDNEIIFTNLSPGDYLLNIKGGFKQQNLNSNLLKIPINVSDAWYNLLIVRIALILLAAGLISLISITRYYQIKKYEQLRSDISQDLHDDVGSMLTGIAMQTELLEQYVDDSIKPTANKIATKSREAISIMRDTVWAIDARKDTSKDLIARVLDFIEDTLIPRNITYNINTNIKKSDQKLSPDIRQNVYLIIKESINNIAKHSDTMKVDFNLQLNKKGVSVSIKDYGTQKKIKKSGQGLNNLEKRAKSIKGSYSFKYDGNGYLSRLSVPL